jgi:uncharacterized delta-60 repeat protein
MSSLAVLRLDPWGRRDTEFGDWGEVLLRPLGASAGASAIAVDEAGRVWVAGYTFRPQESQTDAVVLRILPDGSLDSDFADGGVRVIDVGNTSDGANALSIDSQGRALLAGYRYLDLSIESVLARVLRDGSLDPDFADAGIRVINARNDLDELVAIAEDEQGRIVAAGRSHVGYSDRSQVLVVRVLPQGTLDPAFGDGGIALVTVGSYGFDEGTSLVLADERIYVGATVDMGELAGDLDLGIVALGEDGRVDGEFFGNGRLVFSLSDEAEGGANEKLHALALSADGHLIYAGHSAGDVVVGSVDPAAQVAGDALRFQPCSAHDQPAALVAGERGAWLGLRCWQGFEHDFGLALVKAGAPGDPAQAPEGENSAPIPPPGAGTARDPGGAASGLDHNQGDMLGASGCGCTMGPSGTPASSFFGFLALCCALAFGPWRRAQKGRWH